MPRYSKQDQDLNDDERTLPEPMSWADLSALHGLPIEGASNWRVLTATWMRERDQIRDQLVRAVDNERQTVYIETAYAEMNSQLKTSLEAALQRGVAVEIVTNSLFVTDGGSKGIRFIMARWIRSMIEKYPNLTVRYATAEHGHMIHTKGASFSCQIEPGGSRAYRLSLVGSHNFHGRSGYSDKEHAVLWEQLPRADCLAATALSGPSGLQKDFKDFRHEFYASRSRVAAPKKPLKTYATLADEIEDVRSSGVLSEERAKFANDLLGLLYVTKSTRDGLGTAAVRDDSGHPILRSSSGLFQFLELLSDTGFSDIFGTLL